MRLDLERELDRIVIQATDLARFFDGLAFHHRLLAVRDHQLGDAASLQELEAAGLWEVRADRARQWRREARRLARLLCNGGDPATVARVSANLFRDWTALEREREEARARKEQQSIRGKKGAAARWGIARIREAADGGDHHAWERLAKGLGTRPKGQRARSNRVYNLWRDELRALGDSRWNAPTFGPEAIRSHLRRRGLL